jgi:hypothetical protein
MFKSLLVFGTLLLLTSSVVVSSFDLKHGSRRNFLKAAPFAAVVASSTNFLVEGSRDDASQQVNLSFGTLPAAAYERRDVGDEKNRSASTAAMNEQAFKTNNRLEQSGFKLDTREEEAARLSAAMTSFSYDSVSTKPKSGYRSSSNVGVGSKK